MLVRKISADHPATNTIKETGENIGDDLKRHERKVFRRSRTERIHRNQYEGGAKKDRAQNKKKRRLMKKDRGDVSP